MKNFSIILSALLLIGLGIACKKDNESNKSRSVEGLWKGTYVNEASGSSFFYSFNIKQGGVIEEINTSGEKLGQGTWEIDNNILTATYQWSTPGAGKFSIIASHNKETDKLLGNWGYGTSATNGGTWQMDRAD